MRPTFLSRIPQLYSALALIGALSVTLPGEDWVAPADAAAVANPVPATAASISNGKSLYVSNCLLCHGAGGQGDGAGGVYLTPKPTNLTTPAVTSQSDGALFWKITTGRGLMLGWATVISDEHQRWDVVNYMRSIAPATKK